MVTIRFIRSMSSSASEEKVLKTEETADISDISRWDPLNSPKADETQSSTSTESKCIIPGFEISTSSCFCLMVLFLLLMHFLSLLYRSTRPLEPKPAPKKDDMMDRLLAKAAEVAQHDKEVHKQIEMGKAMSLEVTSTGNEDDDWGPSPDASDAKKAAAKK